MKKASRTLLVSLPLALLLAAGNAGAQFKSQTKPQQGLGSGIDLSAPTSPAALPPTTPGPTLTTKPAPDGKPSSAELVVQDIANCLMAGLPADWTMAQIDVREVGRKDKERNFEAVYSYLDGEGKAGPFTPCDQKEPAMNVYKLNGALEPAKRNWVRATLVFSKEGKFELQYDYAPAKDGEKPAPAAAAKKDAKKAPAKKN